jgi:hypothetical protein
MKLLAPLGVVAVIAIALVWAFDPTLQEMREDRAYYIRQKQRLELEQREWEIAQEQARAPIDTVFWYVWGVGLITVVGIVVWLGVDSYRQRRTPLIYPDASGQFPVSRTMIERGDLLRLVEQIAILTQEVKAIAAQHQPGQLPHSLHYSPHLQLESEQTISSQASSEGLLPPIAAPTFSELLDRGQIGRGQPLLLGIGEDGLIWGDWRDLFVTAIAGLMNSGKSTTARFILSQSVLHGARLVVCDPHGEAQGEASRDTLAGTLEPLSDSYLCQPATDDVSILDAVRLVSQELTERIEGKAVEFPIVLVLDEFSTLMRRRHLSEELAPLVEDLATQGRKFLVFGALLGQQWHAERAGGGSLRGALASAYVHRLKRTDARLLLDLPSSELPRTDQLQPGQALLYRTTGDLIPISIPNTTAEDMRRVARILSDGYKQKPDFVANVKPDSSQNVATSEAATSASQSGKTPSPEALRAAQLFMATSNPAEVVYQMRGVKSNQGGKYQQALVEVMALVREGVQVRN